MKDEGFQLQIEVHPDTRLLQTVRLGPQRSVQVLELFDKYYLLERYKGERRPPVQLDEAPLLARLAQHERLQAEEIEPLLPPLRGVDFLLDDQTTPASRDPLESKLQSAMARFAAQNPETAEVLNLQSSRPPATQAESAYAAHPALGAAAAPADAVRPPVAPLVPAERVPVETWTQPLVQQALQQASDNQQHLLEQAHQLKQEVDRRSLRVERSLDSLPAFQEKLDALSQQLEHWQSEMEKHHFSRDSLLERTDEELARLQHQLRQILSEGLALQKVLREHRFPDHGQMGEKLECFEDMLDHVVQQRHWVHYLQQQQAFRQLERERLGHLRQRRDELLGQIDRLKEAIQDLEQINREILARDPLAVPEPVPALALHELSRLEYEMQVLEADPALRLLEENP